MTQVGLWSTIPQNQIGWNIQSNRLGRINNVYYIFPDGNGPRGSFATFTELAPNLRSRDLIILGGVLREQAVAPLNVYDVSIVGAANLPRQATTATGGVPSAGTVTGGGACWLPPASGAVASTPLLELRAAGWSIENIEFSPVNASAAVRLTRSDTVDTTDASHARFSGCLFASNGGTTQIGIEDNGGCSRVLIEDCRFESLGGTAIKGLNTVAAIPLGWRISRNLFLRNTNAIAMSLTQGLVNNNVLNQAANDSNNKVNLVAVSGQGSLNMVLDNQFSDAAANVTIAKGYKPGTTDVWRNWVTDSASMIVTVPA